MCVPRRHVQDAVCHDRKEPLLETQEEWLAQPHSGIGSSGQRPVRCGCSFPSLLWLPGSSELTLLLRHNRVTSVSKAFTFSLQHLHTGPLPKCLAPSSWPLPRERPVMVQPTERLLTWMCSTAFQSLLPTLGAGIAGPTLHSRKPRCRNADVQGACHLLTLGGISQESQA